MGLKSSVALVLPSADTLAWLHSASLHSIADPQWGQITRASSVSSAVGEFNASDGSVVGVPSETRSSQTGQNKGVFMVRCNKREDREVGGYGCPARIGAYARI